MNDASLKTPLLLTKFFFSRISQVSILSTSLQVVRVLSDNEIKKKFFATVIAYKINFNDGNFWLTLNRR